MTPYEIMLSESQERMLLVAARGREEEVRRIFAKWELDAVEIGTVTDDGLLRVRFHGGGRGRGAGRRRWPTRPRSTRSPPRGPAGRTRSRRFDPLALPAAAPTTARALLALLASPGIASKEWVYRQYDQQVGINTLVLPGLGRGRAARSRARARAWR